VEFPLAFRLDALQSFREASMEYASRRAKAGAWLAAFSLSALCASLGWALSPFVTGHKEPWDSANNYYPLALFVAGLVSGALGPRRKSAYYVGGIAGQLLFVLVFLEAGPLLLVGVAFMAIYSVAFYVAALLANFLRQRVVGMVTRRDSTELR
jgi:hypothetical protein